MGGASVLALLVLAAVAARLTALAAPGSPTQASIMSAEGNVVVNVGEAGDLMLQRWLNVSNQLVPATDVVLTQSQILAQISPLLAALNTSFAATLQAQVSAMQGIIQQQSATIATLQQTLTSERSRAMSTEASITVSVAAYAALPLSLSLATFLEGSLATSIKLVR